MTDAEMTDWIEKKARELRTSMKARVITAAGAEDHLRGCAEGLTDRREQMWSLFDHALTILYEGDG